MYKPNLPQDFRQSEYDFLYPVTEPMIKGAKANKDWLLKQSYLTVLLVFIYSVREHRRLKKSKIA